MNTIEKERQKLKWILEDLPLGDLQVSVSVERGYRLVAVVTTPDFEKMDEADRQALVWRTVYEQFNGDPELPIDFIFTNTPAEEEEIERQEQQRPSP